MSETTLTSVESTCLGADARAALMACTLAAVLVRASAAALQARSETAAAAAPTVGSTVREAGVACFVTATGDAAALSNPYPHTCPASGLLLDVQGPALG